MAGKSAADVMKEGLAEEEGWRNDSPDACAKPAPPAAEGEFRVLPLDDIKPSGHNTRIFREDDPKLQELAASIRENGVLQNVIVRRVSDYVPQHELLAGERRFRASRMAGRQTIPCRVVQCTDAGALVITALENAQREDLRPLEAARAIELLIEAGLTREDAAARLGWSPRQFAQRLQLSQLAPKIANEVEDPKSPLHAWGIEKLLLLARLPRTAQEDWVREKRGEWDGKDFLLRCTTKDLEDAFGHYLHQLATAPWSLSDAQLVPKAGPCTTCPHRSGRQPDLFDGAACGEDGKPAKGERCLLPSCWEAKADANLKAKVVQLKKEHGTKAVILGNAHQPLPKGIGVKPEDVTDEFRVDFKPAKQSDPDAFPVLRVNGRGDVGAVHWMKRAQAGEAGSRRPAPSMEQRTHNAMARRSAFVRGRLRALVEGYLEDLQSPDVAKGRREMGHRVPDVDFLVRLAAACGVRSGHEPGGKWLRLPERVAALAKPDAPTGLWLWAGILDHLRQQLLDSQIEWNAEGRKLLSTLWRWLGGADSEFEQLVADAEKKHKLPQAKAAKKTSAKKAAKKAAKKKAKAQDPTVREGLSVL
jgi:ParB/RepB/Spo0J family partition protein